MSTANKRLIKDDDLLKGLKVSLGLHAALVAIFTVRAAFFTPEKIDYSAAVRVDLVGLPDKMQDQQLPPKQEEAAKPAPPKPEPAPKAPPKEAKVEKAEKPVKAPPKKDAEAINLNKEKNKQKEALEKLKAMAAIEKMKEEAAEKEKESKAKMAGVGDTKSSATKIKGNILSPGTALKGLDKLQHDSYLSSLDHQIKQNWFLPEWLSKKPLRAQVRLKIDEKGQILSREIILSSGNPNYDEQALEAIDKAAPFAAPPEKFVSIVAVSGLVIGFPE
ncbi:MAG: TonB family protein [Bdellovibrionales bacterium]|nr:TonB family protein [Bdellovibrionales bacterium]